MYIIFSVLFFSICTRDGIDWIGFLYSGLVLRMGGFDGVNLVFGVNFAGGLLDCMTIMSAIVGMELRSFLMLSWVIILVYVHTTWIMFESKKNYQPFTQFVCHI